jgi:hypothetical protein
MACAKNPFDCGGGSWFITARKRLKAQGIVILYNRKTGMYYNPATIDKMWLGKNGYRGQSGKNCKITNFS